MTGIEVARTKLNQQEVRDRLLLIEFFKKWAIKKDIVIDPSNTPWCAAFVNACERAAGKPGNGKLNARSFLTYGTPVDVKAAKQGDILIFKRGGSNWQGHVTYFDSITKNAQGQILIRCLGGNQHDSVCYSYYSFDRLLGVRRS